MPISMTAFQRRRRRRIIAIDTAAHTTTPVHFCHAARARATGYPNTPRRCPHEFRRLIKICDIALRLFSYHADELLGG